MELSKQIRKYRHKLNLSQEQLADKIYVTRQTISNWENDKNYPDIQSLLLLSTFFDISIDQLIKGDIDMIKTIIENEDVKKMKILTNIYGILMVMMIVSIAPLFYYLEIYGLIIFGIIFITTMIFAFMIENYKKKHNIQSYKEIVAFFEGYKLDEISRQQELRKRRFQKILLTIGFSLISFLTTIILLTVITTFG